MKKTFLHFASACLVLSALLTACSDDAPEAFEGILHPQLGWIGTGTSTDVKCVQSEGGPQNGQSHRSSGNFDTSSLPDGDYFYWELDSAARADGVYFRVMNDVKFGSDDLVEEYVTHGSLTKVYRSDRLYIADPKNAKAKFQVTVSCVKKGEGSIYVTAAKDHQQGQDHRASSNFDFNNALYEIVLPNDNITFCIQNDVSGGSDNYIYSNLRNG